MPEQSGTQVNARLFSERDFEAMPMFRRFGFRRDTSDNGYHQRLYRPSSADISGRLAIRAKMVDTTDVISAVTIGFDQELLRGEQRDTVRALLAAFLQPFALPSDSDPVRILLERLRSADPAPPPRDTAACVTSDTRVVEENPYAALTQACRRFERLRDSTYVWIVTDKEMQHETAMLQIYAIGAPMPMTGVRGFVELPKPSILGATLSEFENSLQFVNLDLKYIVREARAVNYFSHTPTAFPGTQDSVPPRVRVELDNSLRITSVVAAQLIFVEANGASFRTSMSLTEMSELLSPQKSDLFASASLRALVDSVINGQRPDTAVINVGAISMRISTFSPAGVRVEARPRGSFATAALTIP